MPDYLGFGGFGWGDEWWGGGPLGAGPDLGIRIFIHAVERSSEYRPQSLKLRRALNRTSELSFDLIDKTTIARPLEGEAVELWYQGTVIWRGTVDRVDATDDLHESVAFYRVDCVDYNQLADRIVVAVAYPEGLSLGEIVEDLVTVQTVGEATLADEGVTTGGVQIGPVLGAVHFDYRTLRQAFDDLRAKTGFQWTIDQDRVLRFFDRSTYEAPFSLGIDLHNHTAIHLETDRQDYRNLQIVKAGSQVTSSAKVETFRGDGDTKTFTLRLPVAPDTVPSVKVNGTPKTIGIAERDQEEDFDWFYQEGERTISQAAGASALSSSDTLEVTSLGSFPIVILHLDEDEKAARAAVEGGSGEYVNVESDDTLDSRELALSRSEELLRRWGRIPQRVVASTHRYGILEGHLVPVRDTALGIDGTFLCEEASYRDIGAEHLSARLTLLDGDPDGGWVDYFRRVIEAGIGASISENAEVLLVRKRRETIELSDGLAQSSDPGALYAPEDDAYTVAQIGYIGGVGAWQIGLSQIGQHPLVA